MKKWQEERNYRRVRSEGGEVIANIITVDGMDVEVPEDVYLAYAQADRRERYIMEEQSSGKLLSLEQMEEDALLPDYVGAETAPSAETEALEREELRNLAEQKQILLLALLSLKDTDRELINALFFDGASTREYAQRMGVSQRAVIKRRDRILRDLKKYFENSSKLRVFTARNFREDSEGLRSTPRCSLKSAYQQYGQPPGRKSDPRSVRHDPREALQLLVASDNTCAGPALAAPARRDAVRADNETQSTGQHEEAGLLLGLKAVEIPGNTPVRRSCRTLSVLFPLSHRGARCKYGGNE